MAKKSRRERKLLRERARQSRPRSNENTVPSQPKPSPIETATTEPAPPSVPPPRESGVRLNTSPRSRHLAKCQYRGNTDLIGAAKLDALRALDYRLAHLLGDGTISPDAIEALRQCLELRQFSNACTPHWGSGTKGALNIYEQWDGKVRCQYQLWDFNHIPTFFGDELWRRFRQRIRRGALDAILQGTIGRGTPVTRRRAA